MTEKHDKLKALVETDPEKLQELRDRVRRKLEKDPAARERITEQLLTTQLALQMPPDETFVRGIVNGLASMLSPVGRNRAKGRSSAFLAAYMSRYVAAEFQGDTPPPVLESDDQVEAAIRFANEEFLVNDLPIECDRDEAGNIVIRLREDS